MSEGLLRRLEEQDIGRAVQAPIDAETLAGAARIVADVEREGLPAVQRHAVAFGDAAAGAPLLLGPGALAGALNGLPRADRGALERAAQRVRDFAAAQRASIGPCALRLPGGRAVQDIAPVERAGCYAPGGRHSLPSSVLMTAVTARAAGVAEVWVASPNPAPATLAAAALAGADGLLAAGGAHAIAALAFGAGELPSCDLVCGPGNRWVTAAKQLVAGRVGVDLVAGPSELLIVASDGADPAILAADLLAQAEHDPDARPFLVAFDPSLVERVEAELAHRLETLPTREVARAALGNGGVLLVRDAEQAVRVADDLAPEHCQLVGRRAEALADRLAHYGALFVGAASGEVLGDYGAGPNHVLPTAGAARWSGGLSVFSFLRVRTRLEISTPDASRPMVEDAARIARIEGLEAHARAADARLPPR